MNAPPTKASTSPGTLCAPSIDASVLCATAPRQGTQVLIPRGGLFVNCVMGSGPVHLSEISVCLRPSGGSLLPSLELVEVHHKDPQAKRRCGLGVAGNQLFLIVVQVEIE